MPPAPLRDAAAVPLYTRLVLSGQDFLPHLTYTAPPAGVPSRPGICKKSVNWVTLQSMKNCSCIVNDLDVHLFLGDTQMQWKFEICSESCALQVTYLLWCIVHRRDTCIVSNNSYRFHQLTDTCTCMTRQRQLHHPSQARRFVQHAGCPPSPLPSHHTVTDLRC